MTQCSASFVWLYLPGITVDEERFALALQQRPSATQASRGCVWLLQTWAAAQPRWGLSSQLSQQREPSRLCAQRPAITSSIADTVHAKVIQITLIWLALLQDRVQHRRPDLKEVPKKLIVIGRGYNGLKMGSFLALEACIMGS